MPAAAPPPGTMRPSGPGHARGLVPDPGPTAGTTRYLCEDATFREPSVVAVPGFAAEVRDAAALPAGAPVAIHPAGVGVVAAAAADAARPAVGLLQAATAPGFAAVVQTEGPFSLGDWTAVTGTAALAPRATYFLDVAAARLATGAPSLPGQILQVVGVAVAPGTLAIRPSEAILL